MFKFRIKNYIFKIVNEIDNFSSRFEELVSTFPLCDNKDVDFTMFVKTNSIVINKNGKIFKLNVKIEYRDLYQIFYFFIYFCLNNSQRTFIHSSVVVKNGKAILLLGTFGAGKTTLSLELQKHGYKIASADQSLIEIKDDKLFFTFGSKRYQYNGVNYFLNEEDIEIQAQISEICCLMGVCKNGEIVINEITDSIRKSKKIWASIIWAYTNPLINYSDVLIKKIDVSISNFIKKASNICKNMKNCYGDACLLANYIEINNK